MIEIGKYNNLKAHKETPQGLYLVDEDGEEILLPNRYIPKELALGSMLNAFVYQDSEHRPIATTLVPKMQLHEFAYLQVKSVTTFGAFLDWGVAKDIFCPMSEQPKDLVEGQFYTVFLYIDEQTGRLVASAKINRFIATEVVDLHPNDAVDLFIYSGTDLGYTVIINNLYKGLLYKNEVFKPLRIGQKINGFIKHIREDNKIDVCLQLQGFDGLEPNAELIMQKLKTNKGFLPYTDTTEPAIIAKQLEMSKKSFKKVIGVLYRQQKIRIETDGIYLLLNSK